MIKISFKFRSTVKGFSYAEVNVSKEYSLIDADMAISDIKKVIGLPSGEADIWVDGRPVCSFYFGIPNEKTVEFVCSGKTEKIKFSGISKKFKESLREVI